MSDDSCDWEEAHGVACGVLVKARAEVERLTAEGRRFMDICAEGSARGRAIDLIPKSDWERFRRALEGK